MDRSRIHVLLCLLALTALVVAIPSCASDPVTGRPQFMLLSEDDEMKLGGKTDKQVQSQYGVYDDPKLVAYAEDMCRRLGKLSHRPELTYRLTVLDTPVVNAFAVPGGYVYFTRGILAALSSEAEMAGIMGHEIGHITARHSAEQYSRAQVAQLGLGIGAMLGAPGRIVSGLAQIGVGMLFLGFSRENEREADDLGVEYSSRAGYDAREMARFFETLERMNPGSDRSGLPGWFSTHPSPEDREGAVRRAAAEWRRKLGMSEPKIGRDAYLKHIDGLIYGENPREGYLEKDTFYHPDLQLRFPVPPGWKTKNTRTMVQMVSEKEDAAILFTLSSAGSPEAAAKKFVKDAGASVIESGARQVEGFPAHWVTSRISTQQGVLQLRSCFILFQGKVYEFHGLAAQERFGGYRQAFERTMAGFGRITGREILEVQPDRIRVRSAKQAGSLRKALSGLGVPGDDMEKIALLNGMHPEDPVQAGALIKVVERGRR